MSSELENAIRLLKGLTGRNDIPYIHLTGDNIPIFEDAPIGIKITFNVLNVSNNPLPEYATDGSSGFDLRAWVDEPITLAPMERKLIPTGLFFEIPPNYEIQIRPRSGMAIKNGITVLNTPGTVDADYRGEVKVILINLSSEPFVINNGDKIAQAVISSVIGKVFVNLNTVDKITAQTERGTGGFGHTGI